MRTERRSRGCTCPKLLARIASEARKDGRIAYLEAKVARLEKELDKAVRDAREEPYEENTPSSKRNFKKDTPQEMRARQGGAKDGHVGRGMCPRCRASRRRTARSRSCTTTPPRRSRWRWTSTRRRAESPMSGTSCFQGSCLSDAPECRRRPEPRRSAEAHGCGGPFTSTRRKASERNRTTAPCASERRPCTSLTGYVKVGSDHVSMMGWEKMVSSASPVVNARTRR